MKGQVATAQEAKDQFRIARDTVKQAIDEKRALTPTEAAGVFHIFNTVTVWFVQNAMNKDLRQSVIEGRRVVCLDIRSLEKVHAFLDGMVQRPDPETGQMRGSFNVKNFFYCSIEKPCETPNCADFLHTAIQRFAEVPKIDVPHVKEIFCAAHMQLENPADPKMPDDRLWSLFIVEMAESKGVWKYHVRTACRNHPKNCRLIECNNDKVETFECPKCKNPNIRYCSDAHMRVDAMEHDLACALQNATQADMAKMFELLNKKK
jgi:hypothetical protein